VDVGAAIPPERLPLLLSGVVMLGLGAGLLHLRFGHPVNRAFALFLLLRGGLNLALGASAQSGDVAWRLANDAAIAVPFAALYFGYVFHDRAAGPRRRALVVALLLGAAGVLLAAYALDRALWRGPDGTTGPLFLLQKGRFLVYAAVAWWVGRAAFRPGPAPTRRSALLVGAGFVLDPAFFATTEVFDLALGVIPATPFSQGANLLAILALVPVALFARQVAGAPADPALPRDLRTRVLALLVAALASGVAVGAATSTDAALSVPLSLFVSGLWTLALPVLVTYALVRHQLFGIDLQVKRTIRGSVLLGAFVAAYFLASEGAESLVSDAAGPWFGLGAAALLTLVQGPLQRTATRVAEAAMPGVRPPGELGMEERRALYREQALAVWSDGRLTAKDRRLLEVARTRLGLDQGEARALEEEARRLASPPGRLRPSAAIA
jgi:hypothetical protein